MEALARSSLVWFAWLGACAASPAASTLPPPDPTETATHDRSVPTHTGGDAGTPSSIPDGPSIEKSFTGQDEPTVVVRNAYPVAQHVFIDGRAVGQVLTGQSATFDMARGVHTVTSADSADPDDNPSSVTEAFEAGYGYRYEILAK